MKQPLSYRGHLMDVQHAAAITGLSQQTIGHLVTLRIIEPIDMDENRGALFSLEQTPLLEILASMVNLNFGLEEMRDMVRVVEILGSEPGSERAARYRIRLGAFLQATAQRPVDTDRQIAARKALIAALQNRYAWLTA
jgi:DNA-binding transcriptional MerR regulator